MDVCVTFLVDVCNGTVTASRIPHTTITNKRQWNMRTAAPPKCTFNSNVGFRAALLARNAHWLTQPSLALLLPYTWLIKLHFGTHEAHPALPCDLNTVLVKENETTAARSNIWHVKRTQNLSRICNGGEHLMDTHVSGRLTSVWSFHTAGDYLLRSSGWQCGPTPGSCQHFYKRKEIYGLAEQLPASQGLCSKVLCRWGERQWRMVRWQGRQGCGVCRYTKQSTSGCRLARQNDSKRQLQPSGLRAQQFNFISQKAPKCQPPIYKQAASMFTPWHACASKDRRRWYSSTHSLTGTRSTDALPIANPSITTA
jgi:hypothetical protein